MTLNVAPAHLPTTLGGLRASGWISRPVKEELRRNAIAKIAAGEPLFAGVMGYENTVMPQLENALLAGHDVVFLGERGQAKSRIIRSLTGLLDEWMPIIEGSEINDDPYAPISRHARDLVEELGESTPISWVHHSERFGEKLATPDTSIADLIGEVDRGRIITPLKDRFGSQIRTHYPLEVATEVAIIEQESRPASIGDVEVVVPDFMKEVIATFSHLARQSNHISQRSGVSVRISVSNYEIMCANAVRRALRAGETNVAPRVSDLEALAASTSGKVEIESLEEGREGAILEQIVKAAVLQVYKRLATPATVHIDKVNEILAAFDFDKYSFSVITCEHNYTSAREKIFELLTSKGYTRKFEELSLWDDWYVKN